MGENDKLSDRRIESITRRLFNQIKNDLGDSTLLNDKEMNLKLWHYLESAIECGKDRDKYIRDIKAFIQYEEFGISQTKLAEMYSVSKTTINTNYLSMKNRFERIDRFNRRKEKELLEQQIKDLCFYGANEIVQKKAIDLINTKLDIGNYFDLSNSQNINNTKSVITVFIIECFYKGINPFRILESNIFTEDDIYYMLTKLNPEKVDVKGIQKYLVTKHWNEICTLAFEGEEVILTKEEKKIFEDKKGENKNV